MIQNGLTGETSTSSSVPVSFSLTIDTAVIMEQISIRINPMTPGTKLYDEFIAGLYINWTFGLNEAVFFPDIFSEISSCSFCSTLLI